MREETDPERLSALPRVTQLVDNNDSVIIQGSFSFYKMTVLVKSG